MTLLVSGLNISQCNRQGFTPLFSISMFHLATDFFRPLGSISVELRGNQKSAFNLKMDH